jgi:hypothetical protein
MSPVIDWLKSEDATVKKSMTTKDRVTSIGTLSGGNLNEKLSISIGEASISQLA